MTTMSQTATVPQPSIAALVAPLAQRIRSARRHRAVPVAALARRAGLRPATLRRLEAGDRGLSAEVAGRIARALDIDEEELYPGGRPDAFWERVASLMRRERHAHSLPVALPMAA